MDFWGAQSNPSASACEASRNVVPLFGGGDCVRSRFVDAWTRPELCMGDYSSPIF